MIVGVTVKVDLEVTGGSADELRYAARQELEMLDPEARWYVVITARKDSAHGWVGEVDAYCETDRQS